MDHYTNIRTIILKHMDQYTVYCIQSVSPLTTLKTSKLIAHKAWRMIQNAENALNLRKVCVTSIVAVNHENVDLQRICHHSDYWFLTTTNLMTFNRLKFWSKLSDLEHGLETLQIRFQFWKIFPQDFVEFFRIFFRETRSVTFPRFGFSFDFSIFFWNQLWNQTWPNFVLKNKIKISKSTSTKQKLFSQVEF